MQFGVTSLVCLTVCFLSLPSLSEKNPGLNITDLEHLLQLETVGTFNHLVNEQTGTLGWDQLGTDFNWTSLLHCAWI